ncbi:hypothetical protein OAD66_02370 [Bacteroidia bacterium]|nr:hypothetical protein [Bacteroidia bacterium]
MKNIFFASAFLFIFTVSFSQGKREDLKPRVVFGDLRHDGPYGRSEVLLQEELNVVSNDGNEYKISSFHLI